MKVPEFDTFIAVDWSGAKGKFQKGIKLAKACLGNSSPRIISPPNGGNWSRDNVVHYLNEMSKSTRTLVGFDFSFSGPFMDEGAYFPERDAGVCVKSHWEKVEDLCQGDDHLYAGSLVAHDLYTPHFLTPKLKGENFKRRFRETEIICREKGFGRAESMFHLIGPSQVGLGSYSGMRALLRLKGYDVWPFDKMGGGSTAVEIYTRLFLTKAGVGHKKVRDVLSLNEALRSLNSEGVETSLDIDDHVSDAILSAAGLRAIQNDPKVWSPSGLSDKVRQTEGWVFGVI